MTIRFRPLVLAVSVAAAFASPVTFADNVKIAFIDPLSGPFAPIGQGILRHWQFSAELANQEKWAGSHTFEFVGFDNKGSPQESLSQLKSAIDQGYRYITQGNGSGVALALIDAINKHNDRNPGKEVVYMNYAAVDPDLTNSKCSYWHFRLDANSDQKMEGLTNYMAKTPKIKKVYIIGQNYAHGHQFSRAAKEMLKRKRPDIEIVGDDLHPIASTKDFSPYVAKIKQSGADAVITGNWGTDLALLIRAAKDADLKSDFYTFYAQSTGVPTALGSSGAEKVKLIEYWNKNNARFVPKEEYEIGAKLTQQFKDRYKEDFYVAAAYNGVRMLSNAVKQANSTDPVKVVPAMEGMQFKGLNGNLEMRKTDHQMQQPLYIGTWTKTDGKDVKFDYENTGYGFKTDVRLDSYVAAQPTSCEMKRPKH
ncbi:MAG: branched-chain amino acid ABC transporter substrate-binding protein [Burkholderiales bacterium RIFCSPLOWO2_02_FULL_57_36]|nr:MAG: branched-chain amino acid ABC transporter substrate-binding protein [Burkholderiales bacterium RIFCSPLOWO2_02_FULL_57_36]